MKKYFEGYIVNSKSIGYKRYLYASNFFIHENLSRELDTTIPFSNEFYEIMNHYKVPDSKRGIFRKKLFRAIVDGTQLLDDDIVNFLTTVYSNDFTPEKIEKICFELIVDKNGELYGYEPISKKYFPLSSNNFKIEYKGDRNGILVVSPLHNLSLTGDINTLVDYINAITEEEYNEYLEKYNQMRERNKKKLIERLSTLANKNKFNRLPEEKVQEIRVREKQNDVTFVMENIEFLLSKLKNKNKEIAKKYEKEYETILESEDKKSMTLTPFSLNSLKSLEAKIEFELKYNKNSKTNIFDYFKELRLEYINNLLSGNKNKTNITLDDIDNIVELFLKIKDDYSFKMQREAIRNVSFIYLMEVLENKDFIDRERLENSYFADFLKSIVLSINGLVNTGIFKPNINLELNQDLSVETVLKTINSLERNTIERKVQKQTEKKEQQVESGLAI